MQEVVDRLGKNFEILQLGSEKDVRLKGVINYCGKTSIREIWFIFEKRPPFCWS